MRRIILAACMALSLAIAIAMLGLYCATEYGLFETEPIGVTGLRSFNESGEHKWLDGQVAWIKMGGTHINYPVMQASDNQWYLNHDYYGNDAHSGAIFLDYRNNAQFSDGISIIYGHRMNGDLMFSDVAKYQDQKYFAEHGAGELILMDRAYELKAVGYREIASDDALYRNMSLSGSGGSLLILSTCSRELHGRRNILLLELRLKPLANR